MTNTWVLILLPFIAAAIGWFTNFIAVKMLFHPRHPRKILFITFQGVFPKRQAQVAEKIAQLVANELLSSEDIQAKITDTDGIESIIRQIERRLDHYFTVSLPLKYPFISRLLSEKMKGKIKEEVLAEISVVAPGMIAGHVKEVSNSLDVETMIEARVAALSSEKLEELVWSILDKEFQFIELIGAVIGFIIGLVQVGITLFAF